MHKQLLLHDDILCQDGPCGKLEQILINANIASVEYLVLQDPVSGLRSVVPRRYLILSDEPAVRLELDRAELAELPRHDFNAEGNSTLSQNISDLVVANNDTAVHDPSGATLGHFAGIEVNDSYQVIQLIINSPDGDRLPIADTIGDHTGALTAKLGERTAPATHFSTI